MEYKKNNGLVAVGIIAMLNLIALFIPFIMFFASTLMTAKTMPFRPGQLNIVGMYYVPHIVVNILLSVTTLLLCIGGFAKNNILCGIGLFLNGSVWLFARLFNRLFDMAASSDLYRFEKSLIAAVFKMVKMMKFKEIFRGTAAVAAIFISISFLYVFVILIMKAAKAKGVPAKVIAIILTVLAVSTVLIAGLADIISLNVANKMYVGLSTPPMPYIVKVFRTIQAQFARGLFNGVVPARLMDMEPLGFIVKDLFLMVLVPLITISSAVTIPTKKNVEADK